MSPDAGDVFEVPLSDGRFAYGVAVVGGGCPYVFVLKSAHDVRPLRPEALQDEIALVGWTMDALIHLKRWPIVGKSYPTRPDVPFPNWKVTIRGQMMITDFAGTPLRVATPTEAAALDLQSSRAPIAFQNAMDAVHGLKPWLDTYDRLTVAYVTTHSLLK